MERPFLFTSVVGYLGCIVKWVLLCGWGKSWGGMEWEAGIRRGVTVVTFGMCEIQDWNLKL